MPSEQQLADFFRAHRKTCPECNKDSWLIGDHENPVMLQAAGKNLPFFVTICTWCGFTKFHAAEIVAGWIENHKIHKVN